MDDRLTHLDESGAAHMVDIAHKPITQRLAAAEGRVYMQPQTLQRIQDGALKKGDVLTVARLAAIMAAKRTADLIPLCHPLPLTHIDVQLTLDTQRSAVHIRATVRTHAQTGVEMEALTAVSVAALTVYDMAKAIDRSMRIADIRLLEKRGGQRGDYIAQAADTAADERGNE